MCGIVAEYGTTESEGLEKMLARLVHRGPDEPCGVCKRENAKGWQRIGTLRFSEVVCSYNGDHVIQFHHPRWRDDRNDSSTYIRVRGGRVRR